MVACQLCCGWGGRSKPLPTNYTVFGSAVKFPSGVWSGAQAAKRFSRILNTHDDLSDSKTVGHPQNIGLMA